MKKANFKTETYKTNYNDYYLEIVEHEDVCNNNIINVYSAWIYKKDYERKMFIMSVPKSQQSKEEFIDILENDLLFDIDAVCEESQALERYYAGMYD